MLGIGTYTLDVDQVSVGKRGKPIISDISVQLAPGVTALLGRNGAGKTTFMKVLAGVDRPTNGLVTAGGHDIYQNSAARDAHLASLGWVPQGPGYPGSMTCGRFIEYAAWLKRLNPDTRSSAVEAALEACNAAELSRRTIKSLSGGERQRVILASAIVGSPRFLLLDEPTTGLDPAQRESYLKLLRGLGATTTILYSTHLVDDVVRTATRVLVLDQGQLSRDLRQTDLNVPADQLGDTLREAIIASGDRNA